MELLNLFKKDSQKEDNKLDLKEITPKPLVDSEVNQEGKVTLLRPRFKNEYILKILSPLLKSKYFKIHLDEIGSLVWKHLDGNNTGKELSLILQENVKDGELAEDNIDQMNQRLALFLTSLKKNNFIEFKYEQQQDT